jgi:hypothetical protein
LDLTKTVQVTQEKKKKKEGNTKENTKTQQNNQQTIAIVGAHWLMHGTHALASGIHA